MDAGGAISHHHGIGLNRARFLPDALGARLRGAGLGQGRPRPPRDPQPGQARPARPLRTGALAMSVLVVDVGTSGVRGAVVRPDGDGRARPPRPGAARHAVPGTGRVRRRRPWPPPWSRWPRPAWPRAGRSRRWASPTSGPRPSCGTGPPGSRWRPGSGWQDLRTVGTCLELQGQGIRVAPNASATKVAAILDLADPDRSRSERGELAFGTVDTWVAWTLSGGALHVTDASNAGVTGLIHGDGSGWSPEVLGRPAHPRVPPPHHRRLLGCGRGRPRSCRAGRSSPGWPATSRPPSSARGAPARAWPRPPSAPGACSTSASGRQRPPAGGPGPGRHHPDHRLAPRAAGSPGASRPSCCRPAPAWSGCATTWPSSTPPPTRPRWPVAATTPATSGSSRPCSAWARRCGTSGPGAPSSG